jgi:hypothetical protein
LKLSLFPTYKIGHLINVIGISGSSNAVITAVVEQSHDDMTSHDHASDSVNNRNNTDVSGRIALINRYGHNHEDSDVGDNDQPRSASFNEKNPVQYMARRAAFNVVRASTSLNITLLKTMTYFVKLSEKLSESIQNVWALNRHR